jgi:hypothetical protein
MRPSRAFSALLLASALAVGGGAALGGPAGAATTPVWAVQATANPGAGGLANDSLASVSASGPSEAWAVGTFQNDNAADAPLAEHRNATTWKSVAIPEPAGMQATLSGVDDISPTDAWAVGTSFPDGLGVTPAGLTLIEHWNGTAWSIVPSPNPATGIPGDTDVLTSVSGTGASNVWAAGWETNEATDTISLLFEHWNGTTWTAVTSPTPLMSEQFATGITAISPTDVWAVGQDETDGTKTLAAHWNGTAWSIVPTPDINMAGDQNFLSGVSGTGADNVWASGYAIDDNLRTPYVLHWNGTTWTMTKVPTLGTEGTQLNGVQALSATDAWVVGQTQESNGAIKTLTEQFNGTAWTIVTSPDPGKIATGGLAVPDQAPATATIDSNSLDGVASAGGTNLFAVGVRHTLGQEGLRTLVLNTTTG